MSYGSAAPAYLQLLYVTLQGGIIPKHELIQG